MIPETPAERRLRDASDFHNDSAPAWAAAIDMGREALALLRLWLSTEHPTNHAALRKEARALLARAGGGVDGKADQEGGAVAGEGTSLIAGSPPCWRRPMNREQALAALRQLGRNIGMVASLERRRRLPELSDSDYASMLRTLDEWEKRVHAATDVLAALAAPVPAEPPSLVALRAKIEAMPTREEWLGGQRTKYLNRDEVLGWLAWTPAQAEPAAPPIAKGEAVVCGACDFLMTWPEAISGVCPHCREVHRQRPSALPASSPAASVAMPEIQSGDELLIDCGSARSAGDWITVGPGPSPYPADKTLGLRRAGRVIWRRP